MSNTGEYSHSVTQEEIEGLRLNNTYRQIGAEGINEEEIESEKAKN